MSQREEGGLLEREAYYKNLTYRSRGRVIREGVTERGLNRAFTAFHGAPVSTGQFK